MKEQFKELMERIKNGIIPATVTPWKDVYTYEIAEDDLKTHVRRLCSIDGVVAVICNAHSGEGKMVPKEVKQEVVRLHKQAAGKTPVFSGIAGESTTLAIEEAKAVVDAGADGIMPIPPAVFNYGRIPPKVAIDYYKAIAKAVNVPIILFQFPTWGAAAIPIEACVEIVKMDEVIGFKEASFNPVLFEQTVRAVEPYRHKFTMITGNDTFLYHSYLLGAESALILYANLVTKMHVEKLRAVKRGELSKAMEIRRKLLPLTNLLFGPPEINLIVRVKEALVMKGIFKSSAVLPPQPEITPEERYKLQQILKDLGEI
jgi:4-hydroxy-tetrahydrodipicolinate synthase